MRLYSHRGDRFVTVSSFMSDDPYVVTQRTRCAHWCAGCWSWVVDRVPLIQPLRLPHGLTPRDSFVRSFAYDAGSETLEIRYRWKSAVQLHPITAAMYRELTAQKDVHSCLGHWIE